MGYWWGDGHVDRTRGKVAKVTLTVAMTQPEIRERIERLLRSMGWTGTATERQGCWQITFGDQTLASFLSEWYQGNGLAGAKTPPVWVEHLPLALQRALVQGYYTADGGVDTTHGCILTSVHLDGLLCLRRILMRLGIPSSIRKAHAAQSTEILGRQVNIQQSYTIRFWRGVEQLGYTTRFKGEFSHPYIEDGWLWSRVESVTAVTDEWVPITTATHDYLTAFGRSHNCSNTLEAAWSRTTSRVSLPHHEGVASDLQLYASLFEQIAAAQERQKQAFEFLAKTRVEGKDDVLCVMRAAYPEPQRSSKQVILDSMRDRAGFLPATAQEVLAKEERLFENLRQRRHLLQGAGVECYDRVCQQNPLIAGTAWAAYNAAVEVSDCRNSPSQVAAATAILFGERALERARAFRAAWELTGEPALN